MNGRELAIALTGAGGAGVISCGELLLRARAREGGHGLLRKAFGPQIRGGESAALLTFTSDERYTAAGHYHVLVALDWINFSRFEDEIAIDGDTLVICPEGAALPPQVQALQPELLQLPFTELARQAHPEGRENMLVLGLLGTMLGLSLTVLEELAQLRLRGKDPALGEAAAACIRRGADAARERRLQAPPSRAAEPWYLSGNQAAGYGALCAGVRFAAAYPITPATDALEYLAGGLEQCGGNLVQAEDELAAINMVIGAAFGGVPAFTATSGPGLALMAESIGLAVASETPLVVLNVMRGGPSTGIPTKSEQSDLSIALHGLHGDAPHLVLAPLGIADCAFTTAWASLLSQCLQCPAIVLSDQFLGQSSAVVSAPRLPAALAQPAAVVEGDYLRYRLTQSGVSTLAAPGDAGQRFTADGLEHNERGTPSAAASDHSLQLDKRLRKLEQFDFGPDWGRVDGEGEWVLLGFGSSAAALEEAASMLRDEGMPVRSVVLRLLAPLPRAQLQRTLAGSRQVLVVEQNHGAQLYRYLHSERQLAGLESNSYAAPGPVPLQATRIAARAREVFA